jgi:hypothetical protein
VTIPGRPVTRAVAMIRYSPALVLLAIMIMDSSRAADPDLYGHLRFGERILTTGHIPRVDPYSYSIQGLRWVSHEWLSEVVIAWFYFHGGVVGLKLLKLGCSAALVIILLDAMRETGATPLTQFAILIAASIRLSAQMQFRPQLFTYLLLALLLMLLARDTFRRRAALWITVPMFALWANLHGGFVVGLGVLGLYTIVRGGQDIAAGRGAARLFRLAATTSACIVATIFTPYGPGTMLSVLRTIGNPSMLGAINEWQPLIRATIVEYHVAHLPFLYDFSVFGIFLATAAAIALAPDTGDLAMIAIAAVLVAAAFVQVRNVPLGMIAAMIPLARHATLALAARRTAQSIDSAPRREISLVGQAALVLAALVLAAETGLFSRTLGLTESYPAGALAFMDARGLSGNMLCEYSWNDYVIFHEWAHDKVFLDSRFEMIYPAQVIDDYLAFTFGRAGADRALTRYPNEYVLIDPRTIAAAAMARAPGWTLIYRDRHSLLYARAQSAASGLPGIPVHGSAPAGEFP